MSDYGIALFEQHQKMLEASGITPEVAKQRNYQSVDTKARLDSIDIPKAHRIVPGLLIPVYGPECRDGDASTWQFRPDKPKLNTQGKPVKYVTAMRGMVVDVPPAVRPVLGDPSKPLWVTEGIRKVDSAVSHGIDCLGLLGVFNWRGRNDVGGLTALPAWEDIALNDRDVFVCFDHDVMVNPKVRKALARFCGWLEHRRAAPRLVMLPDVGDGKSGLDDYLASGGTVDQLDDDGRIIWPSELAAFIERGSAPAEPPYEPVPVPLDAGLKVFHRWLHLDDDDAILTVAATVVGNLATGDPSWLLLVAAPSSAKTEVVRAITPLPYVHMASTVTEASLLSGTSAKERASDATGGLLRQVGEFGILCFKDFTSTLSQNKDTAKQALAALREVYDGSWQRPVGSDGGRVLRWSGKCGVIGAVTPSIDRYGQVVSALGDRYLLLRLDSADDPAAVVDAALWHDQDPDKMRRELAEAMCGIIASANLAKVTRHFSNEERAALGRLAIYTATARTVVERDGYTGDLLVMPQPEGPGRLALAFKRVYGGLEALGVNDDEAWRILGRIAVDCVPSVRTILIRHLVDLDKPAKTDAIAESVGMVKRTAERNLEDLALLGMAHRGRDGEKSNSAVVWSASQWLVDHFPSATEKYPPAPIPFEKGESSTPKEHRNMLFDDATTPPRTSLSRFGDDPNERQPHPLDDYDDRNEVPIDPIDEPGGPCSNPTHSPRYDGTTWTCPDCEEESTP